VPDLELAHLDATAQAELVRKKKISPLELVDAAIERLERRNPELNAVIHPCFERARDRARSLGPSDGPFAGVPMVMKDLGGAEAGEPYHAGMAALKAIAHRESRDSYLTERLRAAGFVSLGRTNVPELAILPTSEPLAYGPTRNPYDLGVSAGGSSGGSAAAVASGIVAVAHASDGGGSIRGPANLCGLVGLKPTRARISFGPAAGERWSGLSCELALTRSVRDCAALLDLLSGAMPGDPYVAPLGARAFRDELSAPHEPLRIAVMSVSPRGGPLDRECQAAVHEIAKALEALGHQLEERYPEALDEREAGLHWLTLIASNVARSLDVVAGLLGRALVREDVEPLTWALAERGRDTPAPRLLDAIDFMHGYGRRLRAFWDRDGFDLLLSPVQAKQAPELGRICSTPEEPLRAISRATPYGIFTLPFNLSGQPALALPAMLSSAGRPVGVQLAASYGREDLLIRTAAQLEEAKPWIAQHPARFGCGFAGRGVARCSCTAGHGLC
jgi:amidase